MNIFAVFYFSVFLLSFLLVVTLFAFLIVTSILLFARMLFLCNGSVLQEFAFYYVFNREIKLDVGNHVIKMRYETISNVVDNRVLGLSSIMIELFLHPDVKMRFFVFQVLNVYYFETKHKKFYFLVFYAQNIDSSQVQL